MSPVCHNFVQNAWKKDLCSNCFKSREEHLKQQERSSEIIGIKYVTTPFQKSANYFKRTPPSILKIYPKKKGKGNVRFPEEVSSVIGFGGDDWSDEEEFEVSEDNGDDDLFPETKEEKELHRITKSNTDFNTVKANLLNDTTPKTYTSLLLGKAQTDTDGKKKTLMVSVTPFGQENNTNLTKSHTRESAIIQFTSNTAEETTVSSCSHHKTNIVVTSYNKDSKSNSNISSSSEMVCFEKTLLEEISETLEQNGMSAVTDTETENSTKTDNERKDKEQAEIKKNAIVRHSPITKNQERPKVTPKSEFKFCNINIDNTSVDSAVSTLNSTTDNSLASDDESFNERLDSDNDDSGNFSEPNKTEETVKIKVFNETDKNIKLSPISHRKLDNSSNGYSTFQSPVTELSKQPKNVFSADASRELAGEPDGRADPDEPEAPALPNSPIPTMAPRTSFLHGIISDISPSVKPAVPEKPKLPIKPITVIKQIKKNITNLQQQIVIKQTNTIRKEDDYRTLDALLSEEKNNEITEVQEDKPEPIYFAKPVLTKQDSDTSLNSLNKRKAPTPPSSPSIEENTSTLYQRNPNTFMKSDSPVVREKEKRERASTSNLFKQAIVEDASIESKHVVDSIPEPAPRRNISLSHDNLLIEEKRKGKYKFSIKKLLGIGSSKELDAKKELTLPLKQICTKTEDIYDFVPKPKPRLVIIHPIDVNGSNGVEVVKTNCEVSENLKRLSHDDVSSINSGCSSSTDLETPFQLVTKPPSPPRSSSEDYTSSVIPKRPPPPKSLLLQKKQLQQVLVTLNKSDSNIYANLGEIRSSLTPRKPERTASMREREAQLELPKRRTSLADEKDELDDEPQKNIVQATNEAVINNYDDVYNSTKYDGYSCTEDNNCDSGKSSDSDYEDVNHARSSLPECDSNKPEEKAGDKVRKTEGETSVEYSKYTGTFNRSSLPYCGSETESEIYSPYSFYNSNDAMDNSADDYQNEMGSKTTTKKLRVRKGRSVVHKNLEDNYGAVIIANHEALVQVLEQVQQSANLMPCLRGLKTCSNLRWNDFSLQSKGFVKAGKRVFYHAIWNSSQGPVNVTLMLCKEQMSSHIVCQSVQPQTLSLNAVTEFCDLVPLQHFEDDGEDLVQATIVVLSPVQIDTIQSYGESLNSSEKLNSKEYQLLQHEQTHEAMFMMLQIINGLKCLQARGLEEIPSSLSSFVTVRENQSCQTLQNDDRLNSLSAPKTNCYGRLCVLQGFSEEINCTKVADENLVSLCKCAMNAVDILLPGDKITPLLKDILQEERAISLNQSKSVLEFTLWGPLDVVQGVPCEERELSLQRWLDLERATVLHGLVRSRVQLNVFEQLHLMFLVRSTAKVMCDASVILEKANVYQFV